MSKDGRHRILVSSRCAADGPLLDMRGATWPRFWQEVRHSLHSSGYGDGSLRLYRSVLRGIARSSRQSPDRIGPAHIDFYLRHLGYARRSASWIGMNICVLRTVFDKYCGRSLLHDRRGPRRPKPLPQVLSVDDVSRMLAAATSPRDALLLSLLYGCGLKPGEAMTLRWGAFEPSAGTLQIKNRLFPLPMGLIPLVRAGLARCGSDAYVFAGRKSDRHLTLRTVSRIVQNVAAEAKIHRPVSPMTLRHSYAQHQLRAGMNVRKLQESLGHETLESTWRYCALEPPHATSPMDQLPVPAVAEIPEISVSDSAPPFPIEHPVRYFLNWLKSGCRSFRSSA